MWIEVNPNPCRREEPDCVVRAISLATGRTWEDVHWDLCMLSHINCTMPSVNWLWEAYLKQHRFEKFLLPGNCPNCTTIREFCKQYPKGTYVVATGNHAVCVHDGNYLDLWDSGDSVVTYFFRKRVMKDGV